MLCLSQSFRLVKVLLGSTTQRIFFTVLRDLFLQSSVLKTLLPVLLKLTGRARNFALHTLASNTFLGVCDRSQEVTGGLAWRTLPAHVDKVLFGLTAWTEEDLMSFVQHDDLVEDIVNCLRGLIDCNRMAAPSQARRNSQCFDKFQCAGRIQASSAVVPCTNGGSRDCYRVSLTSSTLYEGVQLTAHLGNAKSNVRNEVGMRWMFTHLTRLRSPPETPLM